MRIRIHNKHYLLHTNLVLQIPGLFFYLYSMKKRSLATALCICFLLFLSCRHRQSPTKPLLPVTTISVDDGRLSTKIKYCGDIKFTGDSTAIESISPRGYLIYHKNDKKLFAESNEHGQITLEMLDGDNSLVLNETGKQFLAETIKEMIAHGIRPAGEKESLQ